jgi:hypothetical protein
MKKLFALLTVVLFAGSMMAQNTATVTESGNLNTATVTQTGSNDAVVDQLNSTSNTATVTQTGSNEAYLTQGMVENYYPSPYNISTNMLADNSIGTIGQIGSDNYSEMVQIGSTNTGSISQNGNRNEGDVYQGWAFGFWGETVITSSLSNSNSQVTLNQFGDDNLGAVWQYGGANDQVHITQVGNTNISQIAQGFIYVDAPYNFSTPVDNTQFNYAAVNQYGNGNTGKAFQLGDHNSFTLTQNGAGNKVGYTALGDLLSRRNAYFDQDGDYNTFVGVQNDGATLDNTSFQFGDHNNIDLLQGAGDNALIQQSGDLNTANVYQYGVGQDASVIQTGNSNTATVTQQ